MPIEIDQDGKKVSVFTQEELDAAVGTATTGLLSKDDAEKLANTAAAKARREAEGKLGDLQAELAKAGNSAARVAELEKQIADATGQVAGTGRKLAGLKVLAKAGLAVDTAEQLLALPALADADFSKEDGQKKAVEAVKALFPQLFSKAPTTIDAGAGSGGKSGTPSVSDNIRRAAGIIV